MIDERDGLVLVALFLFWQCFQVFDVLKHNVRERRSFSLFFYLDLAVVALGAYALYVSIDWLVTWLSSQQTGFISAENLGWLSGWLMVLPNAILACYYAAKRRADIVYLIPDWRRTHLHSVVHWSNGAGWPDTRAHSFKPAWRSCLGAALVHVLCITVANGLPRWMGWPSLAGYAWFVDRRTAESLSVPARRSRAHKLTLSAGRSRNFSQSSKNALWAFNQRGSRRIFGISLVSV